MSNFYLPWNASKTRIKEAENARKNRQEIIAAYSRGQVTRRELVKWGLITAGGALAPIGGLNPFVPSAHAQAITPGGATTLSLSGTVTGLPPSPLNGATKFSAPLWRFDVLPRNAVSTLTPAPTRLANTTQMPLDPNLSEIKGQTGLTGPIEGRPGGEIWAHQLWDQLPPQVAVEVSQAQATTNTSYNPQVANSLNSGIDPTASIPLKFHPVMPVQQPNAVWTFNGTIPPKLVIGRYGEPILFRHHNKLPLDINANNGFGIHTITTHEHNGHHGAENDGFTGAFFYPNQFYDYHWPIQLAGRLSINTTATDPRAGGPTDAGGINKIAGDWHETMSTHWFHDHMFTFTSQNVYKGNAGMFNMYSSLDRGNETLNDGVNLRLPSGTEKSWGNLDYDVNLMLADKCFDANGQLTMDIFDFDGFLGDVMTVNFVYAPFFEVEARKYRFRILNGSVSRFFKIGLADKQGNEQPMFFIANDGNLMPNVLTLTELDEQGIAERYDIVIDFSKYKVGTNLWFVNLLEFQDGKGPSAVLTMSQALNYTGHDPCVGKFMEFRIVRTPAQPDQSQCFDGMPMIPNPDLSAIPVARERTFLFGSGGNQPLPASEETYTTGAGGQNGPWGIETDSQGGVLNASWGRISAAPGYGTREVWTLVNGGGGWDHPIHIHFEEGQVLKRNGDPNQVPAWEKGRKDVYRLRPGGSVTLTMQFRDWGGMYMEHCHNTVHEDNAMLLRWEIDNGGTPFLRPLPTPIPTPQGVNFRDPVDILPTAF